MRSVVGLAMVAASLGLVAGCGTVGSEPDGAAEPSSSGGVSRDGTTELTIVVGTGRGGGERRYTLGCDPARGNHPDPQAACRLLSELEDPFAPVPRDAMCAEVYGGPQTATVTGTLRGAPVKAEFRRTDGCEIARWDRHADLLAEKGGVGSG